MAKATKRKKRKRDEMDSIADQLGAGVDDIPGAEDPNVGTAANYYADDPNVGTLGDYYDDVDLDEEPDDPYSVADVDDRSTEDPNIFVSGDNDRNSGSNSDPAEGDTIASPRKTGGDGVDGDDGVHGLDDQAAATLRALLDAQKEERKRLLEEQARMALGAGLADARAVGSGGGLGLTGATAAVEGDVRQQNLMDLQQGYLDIEDQAAAQQIAALDFFNDAADRAREDEIIALMRDVFGLDVDPGDLDTGGERNPGDPGSTLIDEDGDGFDDTFGIPTNQQPPPGLMTWLNSIGGVGKVTVQGIADFFGVETGDGTILEGTHMLPDGDIRWVREENGMNLFKDHETGETYWVPVGL